MGDLHGHHAGDQWIRLCYKSGRVGSALKIYFIYNYLICTIVYECGKMIVYNAQKALEEMYINIETIKEIA